MAKRRRRPTAFKKLKRRGAKNPKALAASIGRKKLGKREMARRSAAGRRAAARRRRRRR